MTTPEDSDAMTSKKPDVVLLIDQAISLFQSRLEEEEIIPGPVACLSRGQFQWCLDRGFIRRDGVPTELFWEMVRRGIENIPCQKGDDDANHDA